MNRSRKRKRFLSVLTASLFSIFIAAVPAHAEEASPAVTGIQKTAEVDLGQLIQNWASEMDHVFAETKIEPKDTSNNIFDRLGIKDPQFKRYVNTIKAKENPFARLVIGRSIQAKLTPKGEVLSIKVLRPTDANSREVSFFEVVRDTSLKAKFRHANKTSEFDVMPVAASAVVRSTLSQAAASAKIPNKVLKQVEEQLSSTVSSKAVQEGDTFSIVYERRMLDGTDLGSGRLLALEYYSKGEKKAEAFLYENDTTSGYYDFEGNSVEKTFLRLPTEARVTSTFNRVRRHPVTGKLRPHWGIDLAAPTGTPIYAASDGKIITKRYQRRGYGYWLEIDHGSGYQTVYAHMSKYAPGMVVGKSVKKGQLIGYVGRSGMTTGAHLHYELKKDGQQINPLTADLRTGEPIKLDMRTDFVEAVMPLKRQIALLGKIQLAQSGETYQR